ncbi:MAG TPA: glycosyltransferase family A protein [Candidatus Saccharimonadia bacterium]|nr:glycosyltransferase family A protein [Candidatus Saccharimonadia bacterium]
MSPMAAATPGAASGKPPVLVLKARETTGATEQLAVSVVIAYEDPRAHAEHVLTWTKRQTAPADSYEVIVVTDGANPEDELEIARHLRPQDLLVRSQGTERYLLCNVGAEQARADLLFFTEDHCLAEPGAVALAARALRELGSECATVGWGNINRNYVGRFEEKVTEANVEVWQAPDHWNTLRARGFVITTRAFDAAGGFPAGYGLFSEALFTARLHQIGVKAACTQEVGVRHINSETLTELAGNAWNYSHYECVAATQCEPAFFDPYFDTASVLLSHRIPPHEAHTMSRLVWRELARECFPRGRERRPARIAAWARLWLRTLALRHGGWVARTRARMSRLRCWAGCQWWRFHERRRYASFSAWWRTIVHHARVNFLTRDKREHAHLGNGPGQFVGDALGTLHAWGVYPTETAEGQSVRWTGSLAVIPFRLDPGEYEITMDGGSLRGGRCGFPFVLYWEQKRVPRQSLRHNGSKVSFQVKSSGSDRPQRLVILVPVTLRTRPDNRQIGFPITGIEVRAIAAKEGSNAAQSKEAPALA